MPAKPENLDKLDKYRAMRDFAATPEPAGEAAAGDAERPRFVVQEHHATALHWDLRLERDGVLASWAVPKGIPPDPRENHLAVQTEDHPLEYLEFSATIPEGSYGAGQMTIWDTGTYDCHKFEDREVMITFHGNRVHGRYVLFRTRGRNWMIHRMDPPEDPSREPMPKQLHPMLATPGDLPDDTDAFAFEILWDGARVLCYVEGGRVRLERDGTDDISDRFPDVRRLGPSLGAVAAVLDGELVALDDSGRPSADRLDRRLQAGSDAIARRLSTQVPAVFMVYDLLWLEGHPTITLSYEQRRHLLDELALKGPAWQVPPSHPGERALLAAAREQGLAGVVAKRLTSPYEPGARTPDWIEVRS